MATGASACSPENSIESGLGRAFDDRFGKTCGNRSRAQAPWHRTPARTTSGFGPVFATMKRPSQIASCPGCRRQHRQVPRLTIEVEAAAAAIEDHAAGCHAAVPPLGKKRGKPRRRVAARQMPPAADDRGERPESHGGNPVGHRSRRAAGSIRAASPSKTAACRSSRSAARARTAARRRRVRIASTVECAASCVERLPHPHTLETHDWRCSDRRTSPRPAA